MAFVGAGAIAIDSVGQVSKCRGRGKQAVVMSVSRREVLALSALAALAPFAANAEGEAPAKPEPPAKAVATAPTKIIGNYAEDAKNVLSNMENVCSFKKGTPGMSDVVVDVRKEMNEFVARYRRNDKVNGSASFSTLYTAINTLSGHYASYGNNYPVPEKRKKRLTQQFAEVDRALKRGR